MNLPVCLVLHLLHPPAAPIQESKEHRNPLLDFLHCQSCVKAKLIELSHNKKCDLKMKKGSKMHSHHCQFSGLIMHVHLRLSRDWCQS